MLGNGAPDKIRTCDLCLRRAALYPAELRVHAAGTGRTIAKGGLGVKRAAQGRRTPQPKLAPHPAEDNYSPNERGPGPSIDPGWGNGVSTGIAAIGAAPGPGRAPDLCRLDRRALLALDHRARRGGDDLDQPYLLPDQRLCGRASPLSGGAGRRRRPHRHHQGCPGRPDDPHQGRGRSPAGARPASSAGEAGGNAAAPGGEPWGAGRRLCHRLQAGSRYADRGGHRQARLHQAADGAPDGPERPDCEAGCGRPCLARGCRCRGAGGRRYAADADRAPG